MATIAIDVATIAGDTTSVRFKLSRQFGTNQGSSRQHQILHHLIDQITISQLTISVQI